MDSKTIKSVAMAGLETFLRECERAKENKEIKGNERLYNSLIKMEKDIKDLLEKFTEHDKTFKMKGWIGGAKAKGKRKIIETRIAKKALSIRNKYKKEIEEINNIIGE